MLSTTQLSELLKLPILIEHFIEHKQENKDLSFFRFLDIHYAHGNPKDADYDTDMKLPFKTLSNSNITSVCFCSQIPYFKHNTIVHFKTGKQQFFDYSFTYSSTFLSSIWQPPRV